MANTPLVTCRAVLFETAFYYDYDDDDDDDDYRYYYYAVKLSVCTVSESLSLIHI